MPAVEPIVLAARDAFIGAWSLVDYRLIRADGVVRKPWGEEVSGLILYTSDGFMSANLMPSVRKKSLLPDMLSALPAATNDKSHRSSRYIGYAGRFSVDRESIIHHVEVSLFPSWVGLPQVRYYEISLDRLVLKTPPIPRLGKHLVGQLTWKRVG